MLMVKKMKEVALTYKCTICIDVAFTCFFLTYIISNINTSLILMNVMSLKCHVVTVK